jgi:hypothetical protein
MNEQTQQEIYDLAGYDALTLVGQCQWAARHTDAEARKLAAKEWGRKPRHLAYVWDNFRSELDRGISRHEIQSLILIASLNKFERPLLFQQWKDTTMSYAQVQQAVSERRAIKSKDKEPKVCKNCGAPI